MNFINLILIGLRGSGKSSIGLALAEKLNRPFIDLDQEIERYENLSINEIVKEKGWDYFRDIEQKICAQFTEKENQIIATGGGIVEREENILNLKKNGYIIYLKTPIKICAQRIKDSGRPSLTGKPIEEELKEIYEKRKEKYEKAADLIVEDDKKQTINDIIKQIIQNLP